MPHHHHTHRKSNTTVTSIPRMTYHTVNAVIHHPTTHKTINISIRSYDIRDLSRDNCNEVITNFIEDKERDDHNWEDTRDIQATIDGNLINFRAF